MDEKKNKKKKEPASPEPPIRTACRWSSAIRKRTMRRMAG